MAELYVTASGAIRCPGICASSCSAFSHCCPCPQALMQVLWLPTHCKQAQSAAPPRPLWGATRLRGYRVLETLKVVAL